MKLTLSVRSFQTPPTPVTWACPPSLPSVPTSRATRVTSPAKALSCDTMVLTVRAVRRNWPSRLRPSISTAIVWERSPSATAPITRAISLVGRTRSSMMPFTDDTHRPHPPRASPREIRSRIRPSFPTTCPTRSSSSPIRWFISSTPLTRSATLPALPVQSRGSRTEKSPRWNAERARRRVGTSRLSVAGATDMSSSWRRAGGARAMADRGWAAPAAPADGHAPTPPGSRFEATAPIPNDTPSPLGAGTFPARGRALVADREGRRSPPSRCQMRARAPAG